MIKIIKFLLKNVLKIQILGVKMKGKLMNNVQSFSFMRSFAEAMEELDIKEQKEFSWSIYRFVFFDETPNFKGKMRLAWILVEPILIKSKNKSIRNQPETK